MNRPGYARAVLELYVSYFSRPARPADMLRISVVDEPYLVHSPVVNNLTTQGPTATQARRAQIKRNGGKK